MRKFMVVFFSLTLIFGSISATAYAIDCTKDNPIDQFGDWFGNFGKKKAVKNRNIAARRANRLAACAEKEAKKAAKNEKKS